MSKKARVYTPKAIDKAMDRLKKLMRAHRAEHDAGKCEPGLCLIADCKNNSIQHGAQ